MNQAMNQLPAHSGARSRITLALCACAALLEGFDNQSMGVAAPRLIQEFKLSASQSGWIFSAGTLGLALGAMIGGRIADRIGRKWTLIASLFGFGVFSLLTTLVSDPPLLFVVRLLTGLGLGGAMPNFITLAAESVTAAQRLRVVTAIMAALPLGGALAGLMALTDGLGWDWRFIFYAGGLLPIILAAVMITALPESPRFQTNSGLPTNSGDNVPVERIVKILFAKGHASTTLMLWTSFFFTQLILLLMLNWLPTLMVSSGFSRLQASWMAVCFNISGGLGSIVIGRLQSGSRRRMWVVITYLGIAVALVFVGIAKQWLWVTLLATALAGAFIIGAQLVLFALAPLYYASAVRGTGVGGAVAIGRVGSVVGPLFAGALLAGGANTASVLLNLEPFVLIGGIAAYALCSRAQVND